MKGKNMDYMTRQEHEKKMKFLWIAVPIWVVLVLLSGWIYVRPGIYVSGSFLYRSSADCYRRQQNEIRMYQEYDAVRFEVIWDGQENAATLVWSEPTQNNETQVSVTFQDGSIIEGIWRGDTLIDADGKDLSFPAEITVTINEERPPVPNITWSKTFCRLSLGATETRGSVLFIFIGTLAYVLGSLSFLFPNNMYFFLRRWQFEQAELSDAGRFVQKASAIVAMILGGIVIFALNFVVYG